MFVEIDHLFTVDRETGCWLWTGKIDERGYGRFGMALAHRLIWTLCRGQIPNGLVLDHDRACKARHCVNPNHLEPVSQQENVRRGNTGIHNREKTQCKKGHELSLRKSGKRFCRICSNELVRNWYYRNKETVHQKDLGDK